jgi:putative addiction module component (TIGR02574 family)
MSAETLGLFQQALGLDEKDRVILAGLLLESLDEGRDSDAESLWRAEVGKRLEELDTGGIRALSWDEVKSRLLQKPYDPQEN